MEEAGRACTQHWGCLDESNMTRASGKSKSMYMNGNKVSREESEVREGGKSSPPRHEGTKGNGGGTCGDYPGWAPVFMRKRLISSPSVGKRRIMSHYVAFEMLRSPTCGTSPDRRCFHTGNALQGRLLHVFVRKWLISCIFKCGIRNAECGMVGAMSGTLWKASLPFVRESGHRRCKLYLPRMTLPLKARQARNAPRSHDTYA
jgi:hypothetical protein